MIDREHEAVLLERERQIDANRLAHRSPRRRTEARDDAPVRRAGCVRRFDSHTDPNEIASEARRSTVASLSRPVSRYPNIATAMVRVSPGILPAMTMVAPNSLRARENPSRAP